MRHNDYEIVDHCSICAQPIFRPIYWFAKDKMTGRRIPAPLYPTCQHRQPK